MCIVCAKWVCNDPWHRPENAEHLHVVLSASFWGWCVQFVAYHFLVSTHPQKLYVRLLQDLPPSFSEKRQLLIRWSLLKLGLQLDGPISFGQNTTRLFQGKHMTWWLSSSLSPSSSLQIPCTNRWGLVASMLPNWWGLVDSTLLQSIAAFWVHVVGSPFSTTWGWSLELGTSNR